MDQITKAKERFEEQFPRFQGVGARFPMFEETPVYTHIWQFIERELLLAHEEGFREGKNYFRSLKIGENAEEIERKAHQAGREEMRQECLKVLPREWDMTTIPDDAPGILRTANTWNSCREKTINNIKNIK